MPSGSKQPQLLLLQLRQQALNTCSANSQDVGGLVQLEHLQLFVDDLHRTKIFYTDGLGFTEDPGVTSKQRGGFSVLWFNLGHQQMHVVKNAEKCKQQRFAGVVSLVVRDLAQRSQRLQYIADFLKDTAFRFERHERHIHVVSPWGTHMLLFQHPHSDFPGMLGTSQAIGRCYETTVRARLERLVADNGVCVYAGPGQQLVFQEVAEMGPPSSQVAGAQVFEEWYRHWHMALYVTDFSGAYKRLQQLGLIYNKHPYFDKVDSMRDALQCHQFRIQNICWVEDTQGDGGQLQAGTVIYSMENEFRSLHHPRFMRALYNRLGNDFDVPDSMQTIV